MSSTEHPEPVGNNPPDQNASDRETQSTLGTRAPTVSGTETYPGAIATGEATAAGQGASAQPGVGSNAARVGDLLLAVGGILFFVASFLTWISFDFGLDSVCDGIPVEQAGEICAEAIGSVADGLSANAWDLILMSVASVLMILLSVAAIALVLRLVPAGRTLRQYLIVAVLAVDVVMVSFASTFDFSSLGAAFAEDALGGLGGGLGGIGVPFDGGGLPGFALDLGFWLALAGLVAANVGAAVAHHAARGANRTS